MKAVVWSIALLLAALAACSGSSDVCGRALNLSRSLYAQQDCFAPDSGLTSTFDAGAYSAVCEMRIMACSDADHQVLNRILDCVQTVPAYQCKWDTEMGLSTDPSYAAYSTALDNCSDAGTGLSQNCADAGF